MPIGIAHTIFLRVIDEKKKSELKVTSRNAVLKGPSFKHRSHANLVSTVPTSNLLKTQTATVISLFFDFAPKFAI